MEKTLDESTVAPETKPININLKTLTDEVPIEIAGDATVGTLMDTIYESQGAAPNQQSLVLGEKTLDDKSQSLKSCEIEDGATVTMLITQRPVHMQGKYEWMGRSKGAGIAEAYLDLCADGQARHGICEFLDDPPLDYDVLEGAWSSDGNNIVLKASSYGKARVKGKGKGPPEWGKGTSKGKEGELMPTLTFRTDGAHGLFQVHDSAFVCARIYHKTVATGKNKGTKGYSLEEENGKGQENPSKDTKGKGAD